MRTVVTGGGGFVGSHLIEALIADGAEVVCIERPGATNQWLSDLPVQFKDIGLTDVSALASAVQGADVVFHLAALTQARTPREYYEVNTEGTANLLQAMAQVEGAVARLVFMSSLAAAGPCRNGELLTPQTVPYPLSHYGHSKLLAEAVVHAYSDRVPAVILRYPAVYGPRERAVLKLFQLVKHGVALTIGDWDRANSMIYVHDVVRSLLAAARVPRAPGHTYCVAHPVAVTYREFARAVGQQLRCKPILVSLPKGVGQVIALSAEAVGALTGTAAILNRDRIREMTQKRWVCDASRAQVELGFQARYGIAAGVTETAEWYRRAQWI